MLIMPNTHPAWTTNYWQNITLAKTDLDLGEIEKIPAILRVVEPWGIGDTDYQ
jgi:hypothetical protein